VGLGACATFEIQFSCAYDCCGHGEYSVDHIAGTLERPMRFLTRSFGPQSFLLGPGVIEKAAEIKQQQASNSCTRRCLVASFIRSRYRFVCCSRQTPTNKKAGERRKRCVFEIYRRVVVEVGRSTGWSQRTSAAERFGTRVPVSSSFQLFYSCCRL